MRRFVLRLLSVFRRQAADEARDILGRMGARPLIERLDDALSRGRPQTAAPVAQRSPAEAERTG